MSTIANLNVSNDFNLAISNDYQADSSSSMLSHPLTLIVATTPIASSTTTAAATATTALATRLGIGNAGTLPWPRIKSDMSFFARVTTRPPPPTQENDNEQKRVANAIIMGRKTYYSLPKSLRPLAKRINVVITRDGAGGLVEGEVTSELKARREKREAARLEKGGKDEEDTTDAVVTGSLEDAVRELLRPEREMDVGKMFVIGGAEIYASALRLPPNGLGRGMRIVMSKILRKRKDGEALEPSEREPKSSIAGLVPVGGYECDTFFPIEDFSEAAGWREASTPEVSEWVGEEVCSDWTDEGEVAMKIVGYERLNVSE